GAVEAVSGKLGFLCDTAESKTQDFCKAGFTGDAEEARHRQAACYLQTARAELETGFSRLAYCEITERARKSWENNRVWIANQMQSLVIDPCKAFASNGQCRVKIGIW